METGRLSGQQKLLLFAVCLGLAGCESLPPARSTSGEMADELAAHVRFLAQPELKGRKTRSAGARVARRYIEDRFRACGLVPWANEKSYELSFRLGKNLVGVLPGSGTNQEIVVVSAHYDHLGADEKGNLYPGAADNAAGVATLLETARQLSGARQRPKRTIAFAAFDAEEQMLLGSFAFACRPDVDTANIVAVVNVDTLGRDFLDTVRSTVFVAGTDRQPALQAELRKFGTDAGIRVLPIASALIGPRSDHVAFENRVAPCLFFTCGTCADYHKPSDTAENLNYTNLERSAKVILRTVEALAYQFQGGFAGPPECNREELKSAETVLSDLCRNPEKAGIKAQDMVALLQVKDSIGKALEHDTNDPDVCERIFLDAASTLMPHLTGARKGSISVALYPVFEHFYVNYRREWLEGQKQLVAQVLRHPPGLFRALPAFNYEICDLRDQDITLRQTATNTFALHALVNTFRCRTQSKTRIWPFKSSGLDMGADVEMLDCEGSREELVDFCLLQWRRHGTNTSHAQAMKKVLRTVTGNESRSSCTECLDERLRQAGYADETEWLLSCMRSGNPQLVQVAIWAGSGSRDPRIRDAACEVLINRRMRGDVRWDAMRVAVKLPDRKIRLALAEVADDQTPVLKREYVPQFHPDYPLTNNTTFLAMRAVLEWQCSHLTNTIGKEAAQNLARIGKN